MICQSASMVTSQAALTAAAAARSPAAAACPTTMRQVQIDSLQPQRTTRLSASASSVTAVQRAHTHAIGGRASHSRLSTSQLALPRNSSSSPSPARRLATSALTRAPPAGPYGPLLGSPLRARKAAAPPRRRVVATAGASPVLGSLADGQGQGVVGDAVKSGVTGVGEWMDAFVRFTRPHTMIGTAISITSVSLLAVNAQADVSGRMVAGLVQALFPALLMNIYIVGLNQLFDIDIDRVNKPYLPLASGDFSVPTGIAIVTVSAVLSLSLGLMSGSAPLLATLLVSMLLGTAYSIDLPFLRWKRFPVLAASCILAVRAVLVQMGFYTHMQLSVLQQPLLLSQPLVFATAFMCIFSIVIALFKDIPDVAGDRVFGIRSLSVRVGQKKVYWFCVSILLASYAAATAVSFSSTVMWSKVLSVATHAAAAFALWRVASSADLSKQDDLTSVYMFVWKLFYAEYLFLPLLR